MKKRTFNACLAPFIQTIDDPNGLQGRRWFSSRFPAPSLGLLS